MAPARGRAACNGCRSRKQKCDEKKPTCSRCEALGSQCTWPRPQKRGPAKGYLEALEHRLEATETALLRLVSATDEATVRAAFSSDVQSTRPLMDDNSSRAGSESEPVKGGSLVAFWEQYPVGTPEEVLEWAKVTLHGRPRADDEPGPYTNLRVSGGELEPNLETSIDPSLGQTRDADSFMTDDAQVSRQLQLEGWRTGNSPPELSVHSGHSVHSELEHLDRTDQTQAGEPDSVASEAVASKLGVPLEFQRLYVW